ncbi:MAG: FapA family protein [Desulfovibrio sp.]|jgi:uncharacterized protein (DUF342 family)|nr:FapA family protein [Desulfovibrio sp.]
MYYLHHYFNPDFNHTHRAPVQEPDGTVNPRYLGYVQNVVRGQILAELMDLQSFPAKSRDPRFIYEERHLPIGPNCAPHAGNPNKIVATANGYVFYNNGLISVKKLLNIRGDLCFATGNVFYVGETAVHGDIQTGFALHADKVLVKGHIGRSRVKADGDILCLKGIRGGETTESDPHEEKIEEETAEPVALLDAGGNLRLRFCEHAQIRAGGNVIIEESCVHSTLYVGGNLLIKGRLQGGTVVSDGLIYVGDRMGSDFGETTRVVMGYDPFDYLQLHENSDKIAYLEDRKAFFEYMYTRKKDVNNEYEECIRLVKQILKAIIRKNRELWDNFEVEGAPASTCRLVVNGKVMPGCEIYIGKNCLKTQYMDSNLTFLLENGEVAMHHNDQYIRKRQ